MATELQIEANRHNAQLSMGPKTERGKEASRMNALKHGLTAQQRRSLTSGPRTSKPSMPSSLAPWHPRARSNSPCLSGRCPAPGGCGAFIASKRLCFAKRAKPGAMAPPPPRMRSRSCSYVLPLKRMISPNSPAMRSALSGRSNGHFERSSAVKQCAAGVRSSL